jgi:hypothetical protein
MSTPDIPCPFILGATDTWMIVLGQPPRSAPADAARPVCGVVYSYCEGGELQPDQDITDMLDWHYVKAYISVLPAAPPKPENIKTLSWAERWLKRVGIFTPRQRHNR